MEGLIILKKFNSRKKIITSRIIRSLARESVKSSGIIFGGAFIYYKYNHSLFYVHLLIM